MPDPNTKTLQVTVEVDTDEIRQWAEKFADAGKHALAVVLYAFLDHPERFAIGEPDEDDSPAPPASLADELRDVAENYGMSSRASERVDALADRVEVVESQNENMVHNQEVLHDKACKALKERDEAMDRHAEDRNALAEARAEVVAKEDEATQECHRAYRERDEARDSRDAHRDLANRLSTRLEEATQQARTEVDRARAAFDEVENRNLNLEADLHDARANEASDSMQQQAKAWSDIIEHPVFEGALGQGPGNGLENALHRLDSVHAEVERLTDELDKAKHGDWLKEDLPDPADVEPWTAWLIEFEGKRYDARRSPGAHYRYYWSFMKDGAPCSAKDSEVTLVSRLVPDVRRVIDQPKALNALPVGSIVIDKNGDAAQRNPRGDWNRNLWDMDAKALLDGYGPVTVIHEPEVTA